MVEIPDALHSLFSATAQKRDGNYIIELPSEEVTQNAIRPGETYRIGVFSQPDSSTPPTDQPTPPRQHSHSTAESSEQGPPVDEGDVREVTIESLGDQGDGIAKVERGYVVIVPDTKPGDDVTVEITTVRENLAFAQVIAAEQQSL